MNPYMGYVPPQPYMRMSPPEPMEPMSNKPIIEMQLARAYVPDQPYIGLLPLSEALKKGTIFPNLAVPFEIKKKE